MGTGVIVVTDTADAIKRIAEYIDSQNATMTRQVAFEVGVFAVSEDRDADAGINWDGIFRNADVNLNLTTPLVATDPTGVSETELQPGQLKTGFVMTLTPRVLEDDRLLIRFSASLSSLIRLNSPVAVLPFKSLKLMNGRFCKRSSCAQASLWCYRGLSRWSTTTVDKGWGISITFCLAPSLA